MPWQNITTIAQGRARLAESRRMRLARRDLWPAAPHLDAVISYRPAQALNAYEGFVGGLRHARGQRAQIREIVRQRGRVLSAEC